MSPSKEYSTEELVDYFRRAADALLQQAAAANRQATAIERLLPTFEQLRRDVHDVKVDRETDTARVDLALGSINTHLALLSDHIKQAQFDVRDLQRDVTGAFRLHEDKRTQAERIIDKLEGLKTSTKLLIFVLLIVAGLSGWLTHFLNG